MGDYSIFCKKLPGAHSKFRVKGGIGGGYWKEGALSRGRVLRNL